MAHHLGLKVVAEDIETQAQWDFWRVEGCDYGQGYLFSPAIAPEAGEELRKKPPVSFRRCHALNPSLPVQCPLP